MFELSLDSPLHSNTDIHFIKHKHVLSNNKDNIFALQLTLYMLIVLMLIVIGIAPLTHFSPVSHFYTP